MSLAEKPADDVLSTPLLELDDDIAAALDDNNNRAGSPVRNHRRGNNASGWEEGADATGGTSIAPVPSPGLAPPVGGAVSSRSGSAVPRDESDVLLRGDTALTAIASYGGTTAPIKKRPKRVSNYVLGPVMGTGTYGVVRDALDFSGSSARRVAIKVIRTKHRRPQELQRLREVLSNEAHHLQRFHHANVIRAIDIFSDRTGKEYMVLPVAVCSLQQLIDARAHELQRRTSIVSNSNVSDDSFGGSNVFRFTSRSILPTQLAKDLIFQLLAGVQYLHSQGVCHNDLKFANTLLYADGTVKITDLGGCSPNFNGRVNTPAFVSPAVAAGVEGLPIDGQANDVWAVGVILYFLATNRMPFEPGLPIDAAPLDDDVDPSSEAALYQRIASGRVNFAIVPDELNETPKHSPLGPATFPEGTLRHFLSLLLEPDQTKRITSAAALLHPWLLAGEAVKRRESNLASLSKSPEARHRIDTGVAGVTSPGGHENKDPSLLLDLNISSGSLKRVFNVREISGMIDLDTKRHFQFVAEVCHIVALPVPAGLFGPSPQSPAGAAAAAAGGAGGAGGRPGTSSSSAGGGNGSVSSSGAGGGNGSGLREDSDRKARYNTFAGCVNREQFTPVEEYNHYSKKGKPECDVKTLRFDPLKRASLQSYATRIFAFCGFDESSTGSPGTKQGTGGKVGSSGGGAGASACWCCAAM